MAMGAGIDIVVYFVGVAALVFSSLFLAVCVLCRLWLAFLLFL